jgi:hypothetical protein
MSVKIHLPIGAFRGCTETAQIVGCLLQHAECEAFLGDRRRGLGCSSIEMSVAGIIGFRFQEGGELLAR